MGTPQGKPAHAKKFSESTITIESGHTQTMGLGAYEATETMPAFDVAYDPDVADQMGASLERLTVPGKSKYIVVYHFHNFSNKACRVTVRLRP